MKTSDDGVIPTYTRNWNPNCIKSYGEVGIAVDK